MLVFSTNLDPAGLADEAFLRRIGSKISFKPVSRDQYERIWDDVCNARGLVCSPDVLDYVINELVRRCGQSDVAVSSRDLLGMALDFATYSGREARSRRNIEMGLGQLFRRKAGLNFRGGTGEER